MGLNPSSDEWCSRSDFALEGLDVLKIMNDILIQAPTEHEALIILHAVLLCCRAHNLTLSRTKLIMGTSVKFAGFIITDKGTRPDPAKLSTITDFPTPTDVSTFRGFLGISNQLGKFVPNLAHLTEPLRQLLKKMLFLIGDRNMLNLF